MGDDKVLQKFWVSFTNKQAEKSKKTYRNSDLRGKKKKDLSQQAMKISKNKENKAPFIQKDSRLNRGKLRGNMAAKYNFNMSSHNRDYLS